jgi:hypothetical protein
MPAKKKAAFLAGFMEANYPRSLIHKAAMLNRPLTELETLGFILATNELSRDCCGLASFNAPS